MVNKNKIMLLERRLEFMNKHISELKTSRGIERAKAMRDKMTSELKMLESCYSKALYSH